MKANRNLVSVAVVSILLTLACFVQPANAEPTAIPTRVALRVVVLTESDGTNAAASHKQIEQQVMQLRADGARHGIAFEFRATTFVADSQKRHVSADALSRAGGELSTVFPGSKDAIVLYVTGMDVRNATAVNGYVIVHSGEILRSAQNDSAAQDDKVNAEVKPVVVIDTGEFGGQGCGASRDKPCRALTLALADAIASQSSLAALHDAAKTMKQVALRNGRLRESSKSKLMGNLTAP